LTKLQFLIEIDDIIGAGFHTILAASAFLRINEHNAILPSEHRIFRASRNTRRLLTMHTGDRHSLYQNLRLRAPHCLNDLHPKVPFRLRFGYWGPIVSNVLVFTGELAIVTPNTFTDINQDCLHFVNPFSTWRIYRTTLPDAPSPKIPDLPSQLQPMWS
jgi:hypothetical protein